MAEFTRYYCLRLSSPGELNLCPLGALLPRSPKKHRFSRSTFSQPSSVQPTAPWPLPPFWHGLPARVSASSSLAWRRRLSLPLLPQ